MYTSRSASALLFSLILLTLFTTLSLVFMERLIPFTQNVSGIERTNMAYYTMIGAIERTILTIKDGKKPWTIEPRSSTLPASQVFTGYTTIVETGGITLPKSGYGNSEYDPKKEWGIISRNSPLQLVIPEGMVNQGFIAFRIPDLNKNGVYKDDGGLNTLSGYINLTFTDGSGTFQTRNTSAIPSLIKGSDINGSSFNLWGIAGSENISPDVRKLLSEFYTTPPTNCTGYKCTLVFTVLLPLRDDTTGKSIPYLEYQIKDLGKAIPLQYTNLRAEGTVYGYSRFRSIPIRQLTANSVAAFAVAQ